MDKFKYITDRERYNKTFAEDTIFRKQTITFKYPNVNGEKSFVIVDPYLLAYTNVDGLILRGWFYDKDKQGWGLYKISDIEELNLIDRYFFNSIRSDYKNPDDNFEEILATVL